MLIQDVLACSFSNWYPKFASITYKSEIIQATQEFVDYLLEDGIFLPKCCQLEKMTDEDGFFDGVTESDEEVFAPDFPDIETAVRSALKRHKNIFVKLNWSSPEDSRWIQINGTKITSLIEFFTLLKSSYKIVHDLKMPFEHCSDFDESNPPTVKYEIVFREWININPSMEFRCFIANNSIIGICQRDVRSFYQHIGREKDDIVSDIFDFFQLKIRNRFELSDYVVDVYRPSPGEVKLIDMNPFGEVTDSLLFDWNQLRSMANSPRPAEFKDFRYIEERNGIQKQRFEMNSLPLDLFNGNLLISDD